MRLNLFLVSFGKYTHLFPSPLTIQWFFSDYESSPHTKHWPLGHFMAWVSGRCWGAHTCPHVHVPTRTCFCWGSGLQWSGKVRTGSQIPAPRPAPPSCLCLPFTGQRGCHSTVFPPSPLWLRTADHGAFERVACLCFSSLRSGSSLSCEFQDLHLRILALSSPKILCFVWSSEWSCGYSFCFLSQALQAPWN